jgi:SAM-dependent methyltransferase
VSGADLPGQGPSDTRSGEYTRRLVLLEQARWKRLLDVQAPYRWNLHRLAPGLTLDLGCGTGRNLAHLGTDGVGIDHNEGSVAIARSRGFEAFSPSEFVTSGWAVTGAFDSILLAHVIEHMLEEDAEALIRSYLRFLKPDGRLIVITPQEAGYRTDPSHVRFCDFSAITALCHRLGATPMREYSFPFPRRVGHIFPYNEFVVVAEVSG